MKIVMISVISLTWFVTVTIAELSKYSLTNVNILDDDLLAEYKKSPQVRVVYYYKNDFPRLGGFLKQLDKSAEYLTLYEVKTGIYDCNKEKYAEICDEDKVQHNFYTYNNDRELIKLDLETMFDVNSIMSNVLQLVLLREVPILQSKEERVDYEDKYKGKYDIIFGYQRAIGTHEHRIFMEIAYAYHDRFKFAVTTVKQSTEGLVDSKNIKEVGIWVIHCKDTKSRADPCYDTKYEESMDLATLAGYVRALTLPEIFDVPENGVEIPYLKDGDMHVVYLFYSKDNKEDVTRKAKVVSSSFKGVVGVVTVDSDAGTIPIEGFNGGTPALAVALKNQETPIYMEKEFSNLNVYAFVFEQLQTTKREMFVTGKDEGAPVEDTGDDTNTETVSEPDPEKPNEDPDEVEQQDDQVSEAVHRARFKNEMDLDLVPKLTDKTFPKTVQVKNLLFVLFYLPFDDKSMAFLRAYGDASRKLENDTDQPLARVDCHDWTDVCGNEKVIMYPVVKVYQQGKLLMNYNGMLDTDEVVKTFKLLKHAGQSDLYNVEDIQNFLAGVFPDGESVPSNASVLALFDKSHKKGISVFKEVASELKSKFAYGINTNGQGKDIAKMQFNTRLPAIIVLKRSDSLEPFTVFGGSYEKKEILKFMSEATLPKMPELTVQLFPALYSLKKPFVIAFLDNLEKSDIVKTELEKVVKANKYHGVNFCWLPISGNMKGIGRKVLDAYNKTAEIPAVSYVNLMESNVYNFGDETFTEEKINNWLDQVQKGMIKASTLLPKGEWKPLKEGFNFLGMMDYEAKQKIKKEKHSSDIDSDELAAEEHGVGFDSEGNEIDFDNPEEDSSAAEDTSEHDAEIREELLQLRNSRLSHQHEKSKKLQAQHKAEESTTSMDKEQEKHQHVEL